jgi:hypothetical protein
MTIKRASRKYDGEEIDKRKKGEEIIKRIKKGGRFLLIIILDNSQTAKVPITGGMRLGK